jgi:hypothetical protein
MSISVEKINQLLQAGGVRVNLGEIARLKPTVCELIRLVKPDEEFESRGGQYGSLSTPNEVSSPHNSSIKI